MTDRRTFVGTAAGVAAAASGFVPSLHILMRPGRHWVTADVLLRGELV